MWIIRNEMRISFIQFREALFPQGLFSLAQVMLYFPGFNTDNLLSWQNKGYIIRLRRGWYCFREFTGIPESGFLIANNIYSPSYISHQEALHFYGLIPEHIVDSTSVTTKKTSEFTVMERKYRFYSIRQGLFFGYGMKEMVVNGLQRTFLIADREKAILDLLYLFDFYKSYEDLEELRFNESAMTNDIDWSRMENYLTRFGVKTLENKISLLMKIYGV